MKTDKSTKKEEKSPKEEKQDDTYTSKDHPVPEAAETGIDEANESPEVQQREAKEGTEQHDEVPISEEFQLQCIDMVKNASKDQLDFIRTQCMNRSDELRRIEDESKKEKGGVSMDDYAAVKLGD
jgi:hypothetical protein